MSRAFDNSDEWDYQDIEDALEDHIDRNPGIRSHEDMHQRDFFSELTDYDRFGTVDDATEPYEQVLEANRHFGNLSDQQLNNLGDDFEIGDLYDIGLETEDIVAPLDVENNFKRGRDEERKYNKETRRKALKALGLAGFATIIGGVGAAGAGVLSYLANEANDRSKDNQGDINDLGDELNDTQEDVNELENGTDDGDVGAGGGRDSGDYEVEFVNFGEETRYIPHDQLGDNPNDVLEDIEENYSHDRGVRSINRFRQYDNIDEVLIGEDNKVYVSTGGDGYREGPQIDDLFEDAATDGEIDGEIGGDSS